MPIACEDAGTCPVRPHDPLDWIADSARLAPATTAGTAISGAELKRDAAVLAEHLQSHFVPGAVFGSIADNSPEWLVADLALQAAGMVHVPLPLFFSIEQTAHAIHASSMAALFCADALHADRLGFGDEISAGSARAATGLRCFGAPRSTRAARVAVAPPQVSKITFTSGTTGTPKGVMLTTSHQLDAARGVATATASLDIRRHLCLLPLPVLLENVAGAYTSLMTGACCIVPPLRSVGMIGASAFDATRCLNAISSEQPDSVILLPQMLAALVAAVEARPASAFAIPPLRFIAVGGARVPPELIERARRAGLPVYEGYGLSECASVVTLNLPAADRIGTAGRPLPGVAVRVARDGELLVRGRGFAGYLGHGKVANDEWLPTGDLGSIDDQGHVCIVGRKKNVLVTSYGRNVSPEWPESLLTAHPNILQAAVFGDARPCLCAVIVAGASVDDRQISDHLDAVNAGLPDYARLGAWLRADEPFSADNGLCTANGRLRRDAILARYADAIAERYDDASDERQVALPVPTGA